MENSKKSIGEKRVRVNFNPMGTDKIMFKKNYKNIPCIKN